jgi:hypothetical protein
VRPRIRRWIAGGLAAGIGLAGGGLGPLTGCEHPAHDGALPVVQVDDPYCSGGSWLRANLHMHSDHSHGLLGAAALADLYSQNGYGILAITDHNQYGDQDGGILPGKYQTDSLLHDWNGDGATHPEHVVGSGVEAYVRDWAVEPPAWARDRWYRPAEAAIEAVPLMLSGFEASYSYFGAHFVLVGYPPGPIAPPGPGFDWLGTSAAAGGFAFIAHPGNANGMASRFAAALPIAEFQGIEIANGARLTGAPVPGQLVADATPLWDSLLTRGFRLWGLAGDDSHYPPGAAEQYPFTAFIMVLCPEPTEESALAALHRGAFYASTALTFEELRVAGTALRVRVPGARELRFVGSSGRLLVAMAGESAVYVFRGHEGYVRVEARGDPVQGPLNSWPQTAWSQPFRVTTSMSSTP